MNLSKYIGKNVIHRSELPDKLTWPEGWTYTTEDRDVVLMAVVKIWAMVRRPGCVPYVVHVKALVVEEKLCQSATKNPN